MRAAVVALQDQIDDFQNEIAKAKLAIEGQRVAIESAEKALAAFQMERKSYEVVISNGDKAIAQAQKIMEAYQSAVKMLQDLVSIVLSRVVALEKERDSANKRAAILSVVLIIAGTLSQIKR